ncbi:MAG: hypothetical protein D6696_07405 [Acidobacteria bacterium]|nr:MAG: hypothetical protein D6696_07405 [Acidobacteriota bacterium]
MSTLDFDPQTLPWADRDDFPAALDRRLADGTLDDDGAARLREWRERGFLHLQGAVEEALIDRLLEAYERAWTERPPVKLLVEGRGVVPFAELPPRAEIGHHHYRVMDFQDVEPAAREIVLHPTILKHLRLIFDQTPVAMQSLFFEYGSEQRGHQDFPYVQSAVLSHLVGCWVACEDVAPESGPLFYYPGSHRLPKFDWGGGSLAFDGRDESRVASFEAFLDEQCRKAGLERLVLEAEKGDVLLWHAALVHGGSPVTDAGRSRKSFVVHYSSQTAYPRDRRFPDRPPRVLARHGGRLYLPPAPGLGRYARAVLHRLRRLLGG